MDFSMMQLIMYIMYAVVFAHWLACGWSLVAVLERQEGNWVLVGPSPDLLFRLLMPRSSQAAEYSSSTTVLLPQI